MGIAEKWFLIKALVKAESAEDAIELAESSREVEFSATDVSDMHKPTKTQKEMAEVLIIDHINRWYAMRWYDVNLKFQLECNVLEKQIEALEKITGTAHMKAARDRRTIRLRELEKEAKEDRKRRGISNRWED